MTIREKSGGNLNNCSRTVLSVGPDSRGCGHRRAGVVYKGTCDICKQAIFLQHVLMKMSFLGFIEVVFMKRKFEIEI
jgi:hypothetical protein